MVFVGILSSGNVGSVSDYTLRALQKLCFKEYHNTFIGEVKKELLEKDKNKNKPYLFTDKYGVPAIKRFDQFKIVVNQEKVVNEKILIEFYQDVLKTESAKKILDIVDFGGLGEVLDETYDTLELLEIALERVCYIKTEVWFDEKTKAIFMDSFQAIVFEIASYDLRIQDEKRPEVLENHQQKNHTEKWLDFWSDTNKKSDYDIRLNPEITISYREVDEALWKKYANHEIDPPVLLKRYTHRYLQEYFTLNTTLSLNANSKEIHLAFHETEEIAKKIDLFNEDFNRKFEQKYSKNAVWYYGIDRGIKELATLCIARFTDEIYEIHKKKLNTPHFAEIEVYKLKNENGKGKIRSKYDDSEREADIIKNISYFMDDENLFEKSFTSCINLTEAKLIKGKIVINGDKNTYLKLKELSAKRRIFELFSKTKIDKSSILKIEEQNGLFLVRKDLGEEQIYWFTEDQKINSHAKKEQKKEQQEVQECLKKQCEDYLNELDKNNTYEDIETITKINHLRDAITANMVGIIAFLQNKFPGKICLENMEIQRGQKERIKDGEHAGIKEKMIEGHFDQSNQDISRRLEWSLYRKFQETGLVPPEIKKSIFLRDEFGAKQFGTIEFVRIGNTSKNCPYCENTHEKKNGHYICKDTINCCFDSRTKDKRKGLDDLENSDKVGAYNIAKNGFKKLYDEDGSNT